MRDGLLKVGTLARRTGLTVRALHYYGEIGLLVPSRRTDSGHRLYGADDVRRLQQILSLRQLGFSLEEIRACLERSETSFRKTLGMHIAHLRERIRSQQRLCERLEWMAAHADAAEIASVEDFLQTIREMNMIEQYYTPEQLEQLRLRREALGEDGMRRAQEEWQTLIAEARAEMEQGSDPASEPVQRLADRWRALVEAFTGGDPGISASLERMYREQGAEQASRGAMDLEVAGFMRRAMSAKKD